MYSLLTSELNLSWQTLHEIICFFLGGTETPNVWLMTAFCTGSIWRANRIKITDGKFISEMLENLHEY